MCIKAFWTSNYIVTLLKPLILPEAEVLKRKWRLLFRILMISWFHTVGIYVMTIHAIEFRNTDISVRKKIHIVLIMWNLFSFIMWYSMIFNRASVRKMFSEYKSFETYFKDCSPRWYKIIINAMTSSILLIYLISIVAFIIYLLMNDDFKIVIFKDFQDIGTNIHIKKMLIFFYLVSSRTVFTFFPSVVMVFHISLMAHLILTISYCKKEMQNKTEKSLESFMKKYSRVHRMATTFESAVSLETLFLTFYQYSLMYFLISNLFGFGMNFNDILTEIFHVLHCIQPFLYIAMLLAASEVNNQDNLLRTAVKNWVFRLSIHHTTSGNSDMLSKFMYSKPVITFTAWKMFSFTRTFIVTSTGALLTYSLLVMQLRTPDE